MKKIPNWCDCELIIQGPANARQEFKKACKGVRGGTQDQMTGEPATELDFNKFIPMPKLKGDGWYTWSCEHWGTKWNASSASWGDDTQSSSRLFFQTAWSPPEPVIAAMSDQFPELTFKLDAAEAGMGYRIWQTWKHGKLVHERDSEYRGTRGG